MLLFDGSKFRSAREAMGWTQRKLAERLEVSHNTVAKWEDGQTDPNQLNLCKAAEVLRQPITQFFTEAT
jgi:transcriptional regulator with XRE-family HTH domain